MRRIAALFTILFTTIFPLVTLHGEEITGDVEISTEDIPRFCAAYDLAKTAPDRAAVFQSLFIDKVDPRVRQFIRPSKMYADMTLHYPRFWESIRPNTERIAEKREEMRRTFRRFAEIYPAFRPPRLHFSISACQTGGTVKDGIVFFGTAILVFMLTLPALIAPADDVHRVTAGMFTISYSCAVIVPIFSGLLWDLTGAAVSAFIPIIACSMVLMALAPSLRLPHD